MSDEALEHYLVRRAIPSEIDDGLLWLRHGMFSRLRYADYLEIFKRYFSIEHVILGVSGDALRHKRTHAAEWGALAERFDEADLLTFSMTIWMRPKVPAARIIEFAEARRAGQAAHAPQEPAALLRRMCA
jgi:hypothetical protein